MLAYHVEWHMRRRLAPLLFEDDDREGARAQRSSSVEPASISESAKAKADTKRAPEELPVHSFTNLLSDLGTLTLSHASLPGRPAAGSCWPRSRSNCRHGRSNCWEWTRIAMTA